jgi:uncharacterized coiled-coil protein SlyX
MSWLDSKTDDELFDNSTLCVTAKEYQDLNIRLGLEIGKKQDRIEELEKVCAMALDALEQNMHDYCIKCNTPMESNEHPAAPSQEPVTVLPDGSAFFIASFPLPKDHWLYAPTCEGWDNERDTSADTPYPILTHAQGDAVIAAVRYAIRGATMNGKESDFDPDALVQNAVYALCGPYTIAKPAQAAPSQEPDYHIVVGVHGSVSIKGGLKHPHGTALYATPPDAAAQIAELTSICHSFELQVDAGEKLIAELKVEIDEDNKVIQRDEEDIERLHEQIAKLNSDLNTAKGLLREGRYAELCAEMTAKDEQIATLEDRITELERACALALKTIDELDHKECYWKDDDMCVCGKTEAITALRNVLGEKHE